MIFSLASDLALRSAYLFGLAGFVLVLFAGFFVFLAMYRKLGQNIQVLTEQLVDAERQTQAREHQLAATISELEQTGTTLAHLSENLRYQEKKFEDAAAQEDAIHAHKDREMDKTKTEFLSLASHQLRTPLSAISWYAEMLLAGDAGGLTLEQRKFIQEIYDSNQRMAELVKTLLSVSHLELGTFMAEPESIRIVEIAKSVVAELKSDIKKKKLQFFERYAAGIPVIIADPKLVRMIIRNLLSNTVKYTPNEEKAGIGISVKKAGDDAEGRTIAHDCIFIEVADTGIGIPAAQHGNIFSKLFRADNARAEDTEGTGLGLYIVKSVVSQLKGDVWFESVEGKGTTFYVLVPINTP